MISVVIIVKNDTDIEYTLASLERIKRPCETETLVVDASDPATLLRVKERFPQVVWAYADPKPNKDTRPEQRNLGIKMSRGDIIAFVDAGCIPADDWLVELVRPIVDEGEDIVAGRVTAARGSSVHDVVWEKRGKKKYISDCPTLNVAFRKRIVDVVGLFDESLEFGEDIDFMWRAGARGFRIRYNADAVVSHDWGGLRQEIKRAYKYGKGRALLYRIHPERRTDLFGFDAYTLLFPLYVLFLPLTIVWPAYPLLLLVPLVRNLVTKSLRARAVEKVFLDMTYGIGVLVGLALLPSISRRMRRLAS